MAESITRREAAGVIGALVLAAGSFVWVQRTLAEGQKSNTDLAANVQSQIGDLKLELTTSNLETRGRLGRIEDKLGLDGQWVTRDELRSILETMGDLNPGMKVPRVPAAR